MVTRTRTTRYPYKKVPGSQCTFIYVRTVVLLCYSRLLILYPRKIIKSRNKRKNEIYEPRRLCDTGMYVTCGTLLMYLGTVPVLLCTGTGYTKAREVEI